MNIPDLEKDLLQPNTSSNVFSAICKPSVPWHRWSLFFLSLRKDPKKKKKKRKDLDHQAHDSDLGEKL